VMRKLANEGNDFRPIQDYLGHANAQSTVRYTALSERFKKFRWGQSSSPALRTEDAMCVESAVERRLRVVEELARRGATPGEQAAAEKAVSRLKSAHYALQPIGAPTEPDDPLIGLRLRLDRTCDHSGCAAMP
jgi:hypothetical protein